MESNKRKRPPKKVPAPTFDNSSNMRLAGHFEMHHRPDLCEYATSALLDRLTHRCNIVQVIGESYRFKESVRRKKGKKAA